MSAQQTSVVERYPIPEDATDASGVWQTLPNKIFSFSFTNSAQKPEEIKVLTASAQRSKESSDGDLLEVRSGQKKAIRSKQFVPLPSTKQQLTSCIVLMECEGVVDQIDTDFFFAKLNLIRGHEAIDTFDGEIPIEEVSRGDKELLVEGALFRWSVGYDSYNGTRSRFSRLVFRRLPAWSKSSLTKAQSDMEELIGGIRWSDGPID